MKVITARNVNDALLLGLNALQSYGVKRDSRAGPVKLFPYPVTTEYKKPNERVIFYPERDANPFFHFMESLWMLAGRNDVEWISRFNSSFSQFSDDGVTFHGAYGWRWRNHFLVEVEGDIGVVDQLETIANVLSKNPDDRRCVLQMWHCPVDLGQKGKDFPCNLSATFQVNPYGKLDMVVHNRSNDMIWGAYGANAVHFSVLQEVMAAWIGVPIGSYWQVSSNFHCYENTLEKHAAVMDNSVGFDEYELGEVKSYPIVNGPIENWLQDLHVFMTEGPVMGFQDNFFKKVASPIWQAWSMWKDKENSNHVAEAIALCDYIAATDWQLACKEWLQRRV